MNDTKLILKIEYANGYEIQIRICEDIFTSIRETGYKEDIDFTGYDGARAMHFSSDRGDSYIFLPVKYDVEVVAHECYHCINAIMHYLGAGHDNEIMAYHIGWLVKKVSELYLQRKAAVKEVSRLKKLPSKTKKTVDKPKK